MINYFEIKNFVFSEGFKEETLYKHLVDALNVNMLINIGSPVDILGGNKKQVTLYSPELKDRKIRLEGYPYEIDLFVNYLHKRHLTTSRFKINNKRRVFNKFMDNIEELYKK